MRSPNIQKHILTIFQTRFKKAKWDLCQSEAISLTTESWDSRNYKAEIRQ